MYSDSQTLFQCTDIVKPISKAFYYMNSLEKFLKNASEKVLQKIA